MRVDNFSPRTWLLAGVAGWAVCLWVFALAGLGARIGTGEDAADPQPLPSTTIPRADRPGPQAQYAEIASRPIFSETRKPQPFVIDGAGQEAQANTFDFTLTSVLIAGDVQVAILKPAADGAQPVRVKLGDALETAPQWSLASLQPRGAVFRGPDGEKTLELRVFNGVGGVAPTPAAPAPPPPPVINETIGPPVQPGPGQPVAPPVQPPPTEPVSAQVQLEAIRKRIEARRAQLRQQNAQEAPNPGPPPGQTP